MYYYYGISCQLISRRVNGLWLLPVLFSRSRSLKSGRDTTTRRNLISGPFCTTLIIFVALYYYYYYYVRTRGDGLRYRTTADGKGSDEGRARSVTTRSNLPTREAIALSADIYYIYTYIRIVFDIGITLLPRPTLEKPFRPTTIELHNYIILYTYYIYLIFDVRKKKNRSKKYMRVCAACLYIYIL